MTEYNYKKVKGYNQKKFTENGHTMFEEDVLQRLKRLAYLEDKLEKQKLEEYEKDHAEAYYCRKFLALSEIDCICYLEYA